MDFTLYFLNHHVDPTCLLLVDDKKWLATYVISRPNATFAITRKSGKKKPQVTCVNPLLSLIKFAKLGVKQRFFSPSHCLKGYFKIL